ncbi:MAG: 1-phosphofructokinase family hexose kinase [Sphaerochaetaceae bacterium]
MRHLVVCLNPSLQRTMVFASFLQGEVNRSSTYRFDFSGKGVNTARVITQLGEKALHLTHLDPAHSDELLSMLAKDGIETVWTDSGSPMRTCTTIIDLSKGLTTELVEEAKSVSSHADHHIRRLFSEALQSSHTLIISGTRAPGYSENLYVDMVKEAKEAGKLVILDLKGTDLIGALNHRVDLIKPNLSEFAATFMPEYTVREQVDATEIKEAVISCQKQLYEEHGTKSVLTRGAFSVWAYGEQGFGEFPVPAVKAVNTIGSGDTVTAALAVELGRGKSLFAAVKRAVACGSANASNLRPGSVVDEKTGKLLC